MSPTSSAPLAIRLVCPVKRWTSVRPLFLLHIMLTTASANRNGAVAVWIRPFSSRTYVDQLRDEVLRQLQLGETPLLNRLEMPEESTALSCPVPARAVRGRRVASSRQLAADADFQPPIQLAVVLPRRLSITLYGSAGIVRALHLKGTISSDLLCWPARRNPLVERDVLPCCLKHLVLKQLDGLPALFGGLLAETFLRCATPRFRYAGAPARPSARRSGVSWRPVHRPR